MVMIKQVIDGKTYNTETARCLATVDLMGYRTDQRGRFTTNTPKKVGTTSLLKPVTVRTSWYAIMTPPPTLPTPTLPGSFASMIAV
jgi:hypothetical protein